MVPDLLQTPAYTRALLPTSPTFSAAEIEQRVAETARRQLILGRSRAPRLRAFIDEHVLTRAGAGDQVMADQAKHLLQMTAKPNIGIRVVPEHHSIPQLAAFTLLKFAGPPTVAYVEFLTAESFIERKETINVYELFVTALDQRALDAASSRTWLAGIAEQRGLRDSPHDR